VFLVTPILASGCLVSLGSDDTSPAPGRTVNVPAYSGGSVDGSSTAHRADAGDDGDAIADATSDTSDEASDASPANVPPDAAIDAAIDAPPEASSGCTLTSCGTREVCVSGSCVLARRVFVSSATYTAQLGGYAGADATCQTLANAAGLGGVWMAWISDGSSSPSARFTRASYAYRLLDGTTVAASYSALTGGSLAHAIDRDERAHAVSGTTEVWTATNTDGTLAASACNGFTSSSHGAAYAVEGISGNADGTWTNVYEQFCDRTAHLYCVEQ
jgi:hypothetical protein